MATRRHVVLAGLGLAALPPQAASARSYSQREIEKLIDGGDIRGRLDRDDLPTPALLLDLDAFEANVASMARYLGERKRAFRPHGKTHKCSEIARRLVSAGAVGACGAKISEAEAFARGGVRGLLVTTAVVGRYKIERAVQLARLAPDTIFVVDNEKNAADLNDAAGAARIRLNLAIDLLVGGRTGIAPGAPAVALAERLVKLPHTRFAGLQAYAGPASHVTGFEQRRQASRDAMAPAVETRGMLETKGISCPWLSGGSTGTYNIDSEVDGITEIQPGSFMFMDLDYNRIGGKDGAVYQDFRNALTVYTTVVSKPAPNTAIVDGGFKAFSTDRPFPPQPKGSGLSYAFAGDEHGRVSIGDGAAPLEVGDRVEFVAPHCDPTVNLYDRIFCLRGTRVESAWRIDARGMSQ